MNVFFPKPNFKLKIFSKIIQNKKLKSANKLFDFFCGRGSTITAETYRAARCSFEQNSVGEKLKTRRVRANRIRIFLKKNRYICICKKIKNKYRAR